MLGIHVHLIPCADLHVGDTLRIPHPVIRVQARPRRITLRRTSGIGAKLAVHEEEFGGRDSLIEKGFEGVRVVVQHIFQGFEAVGNVICAVVPPTAAHTPFVVTVAASGVVLVGGAVELELVDIRVERAGDDDFVVLERLGDEIGVECQSHVLRDGVDVFNLGGEISIGYEVEEESEVRHYHDNGVLDVGLQLSRDSGEIAAHLGDL